MNLGHILKSLGRTLSNAIFPACCEVCGRSLVKGEDLICLHCLYGLPKTMIHNDPFNTIHQRIADVGVPIQRAGAWFYYIKDNDYARLIQRAKYNDRPSIARKLATIYAAELVKDDFFRDIDILLPIPLHALKRIRRGYNQSEEICIGLSSVTGLPISDNLHMRHHGTQTRRNATQRHANLMNAVTVVHPEELKGKHLLLVDDVITTGATMHAAAKAITEAVEGVKISVLALSCTHLG